jgi:hypothetical protein
MENVTVKLKYCSPEYKLLQYRQNSIDYENKLQLVIDNKLRNIKYQMDMYIEKLNGLSPVNKLKSGYSMVTSKDKIVKSVEVIEKGDEVNIALLDGEIVAKVDKVLGTVYKFPVCLEDKTVSMPYTKIRLKVVKNVKGKLKEGKYIEVLKAGGKEKKGSKYIVYDNDVVCKKGGTYLFSTYVQKDGSLLATGANSTIKTNKNYKDNVSYSKACSSKSKKLTKSRSRYKIKNSKVYM